MKRSFKIGLISVSIFVIVCVVTFLVWPPKIVLNGEDNVIIGYNGVYQELGAYSKKFGHDYDVKIKSDVDTTKLGEYKVVYSLKYLFFNIERTRNVDVIDNKKPVISLTGDESVHVCPNKDYQEEGFSSIDDYDGDISNSVIREITNEGILYSSIDSNGNKSQILRRVIKEDVEGPTISLNGKDTIYMYVGNKYYESGYSAFDNCDGDLTGSVVVTNNVNVNKLGSYDVVYSVSDSSGNSTSVIRKVVVIDKNMDNGSIYSGTIYLTFDDGPSHYTSRLLDILNKHNVKATFFVTGRGNDNDILRIYNEGHSIGLHTYSHRYSSVYESADAYFYDLSLINDRVKRITGFESKIIRFPGGSSNTVSKNYSVGIMSYLTNEVLNRGYKYYDWNISSGDGGGVHDKTGVYNNVVNGLKKNQGNVVLMHDTNDFTVDAVEDIILFGLANGYKFDVINYDTKMVTHKVNN